MSRFEKPGDNARAKTINRPALNRETLALLGARGDIDPALLLVLKHNASDNPWTLAGGATLEAASNRGVVEAAEDVVLLDAQNESASYSVLGGDGGLPVGAYRIRVRCKASAAVAGDLGIKVENVTDSTTILAEVTRQPATSGYAIVDVLFSVRAADAGDSIKVTLTKKTATANSIRVDCSAHHPLSAEDRAWGRVPDGGRIEYARNGAGLPTAHTIYDAQTGGNAIETAAYTYNGTVTDQLDSLAYTRDGATMTKTYTYGGTGLLDRVSRSVA